MSSRANSKIGFENFALTMGVVNDDGFSKLIRTTGYKNLKQNTTIISAY